MSPIKIIHHDYLAGYLADEHRAWESSIAQVIHDDNIAESSVTQHVGAIDHDSLLNFVGNEHIDWTSSPAGKAIAVASGQSISDGVATLISGALTGLTNLTAEQLTSTDDITMEGNALTLGDGATDNNTVITFLGLKDTGVITYAPITDTFGFNADVLLGGNDLTTTGTITAEQLTSTDDLFVQGDVFHFGNGATNDVKIMEWQGLNNFLTFHYDPATHEFDFGDADEYWFSGRLRPDHVIAKTVAVAGAFDDGFGTSGGFGTIVQLDSINVANINSIQGIYDLNWAAGVSTGDIVQIIANPRWHHGGGNGDADRIINFQSRLSAKWATVGDIGTWWGYNNNPNFDANMAGTITEWVGYNHEAFDFSTIDVTNAYGLRIGDIKNAGTNYAIYTGLGTVHLGDDVEVSGRISCTGMVNNLATKTNDYTLVASDYTILADATSNTVTITLPASPNQGQIFNISCINAIFTCTVDRNGKNIDGIANDLILVLDENAKLQYDSTYEWKRL